MMTQRSPDDEIAVLEDALEFWVEMAMGLGALVAAEHPIRHEANHLLIRMDYFARLKGEETDVKDVG